MENKRKVSFTRTQRRVTKPVFKQIASYFSKLLIKAFTVELSRTMLESLIVMHEKILTNLTA